MLGLDDFTNGEFNMRTQEIALFYNPDGTVGFHALGLETPEECTHRLQKEGKREILIIKVKLAYWSA